MYRLIIAFALLFGACGVPIENEPGPTGDRFTEQGEQWLKEIKNLGEKALNEGEKLSSDAYKKLKEIELNGFSVEDDIKMGQQLYDEIQSSTDYVVLPKSENGYLYAYVEKIKNTILANSELKYEDIFDWRITILKDDKIVNAFCAPGGFIFVYTGILKYLDNEAEFAGVLAHEIAHAERRHGTRQLTKSMGIQTLLAFLSEGENSQYFNDVISGLVGLRYSRSYEREADECSVKFLCKTSYAADGAAGFFKKIIKEEGERSMELLSTHPDPQERIGKFHSFKKECQCKGKEVYTERYKKMQKMI
jgi:predicted Zn-dependent protease